jgi:hypothetical protein
MISPYTNVDGASPVFYDFEASALDGCPIEIGWAWFDGTSVRAESHLILPDPIWQIESSWDNRAQELHGIGALPISESVSRSRKPAIKKRQPSKILRS